MAIIIDKIQHFTKGGLIKRLGIVTLKTSNIMPYENAEIRLLPMSPEYITPCQNYVLQDNLKRTRELDWALTDIGIDMFSLGGFIRIWLKGYDKPMDLTPPIIEVENIMGNYTYLLCDGMHRIYHAMLSWREPECIIIRKANKDYPYYAHPIPGINPWDKVEVIKALNPGFIKKWHRFPNSKDYYRNFNSVFINVGASRGNGETRTKEQIWQGPCLINKENCGPAVVRGGSKDTTYGSLHRSEDLSDDLK